MNARNLSRTLALAVSVVLAGMFAFSGNAFAAKGGIPGPPNGGDETAAQNLSVPTIMFGTPPGGLECGTELEEPTELVPPKGIPVDGYTGPAENPPLDPTDYYWVQKVHTWQAQCFQAGAANVWGNWGDNLEGDAKLKVGSPIRVEIVLTNEDDYPKIPSLLGYTVIKLEDLLDRESDYGHLAGVDAENGFTDIPTVFDDSTTWLVHDSGITFSVLNMNTNVYAVRPGSNPTAEINATGKVVYGYNLRVGEPGAYRIQFNTSPTVHFLGQDAVNGGLIDLDDDETNGYEAAYIEIQVVSGGGGGGGNGNGNGPKK